MNGRRPIIVHYHIYKNAGSSVDTALRNCLGGDALVELDKDSAYKDVFAPNRAFIEGVARDRPELQAFSAHRIVPSVHYSREFDVRAIVFLRHPLLRAASVHRFERERTDDWHGTAAARAMDLAAWLDWALTPGNSIEVSNYQTRFLSMQEDGRITVPQRGPNLVGDLDLAIARIGDLPVVGLVERFEESAARMEAWLSPAFPGLRLCGAGANRTRAVSDWREEVARLEASLPAATLALFREKNAQDQVLFDRALAALEGEGTHGSGPQSLLPDEDSPTGLQSSARRDGA